MRLFDSLGYYVLMINETMKDVNAFLVLFGMCVFMFSNAFFILDSKQHIHARRLEEEG